MEILLFIPLILIGYALTYAAWEFTFNKILLKWEERILEGIPPVPLKIKYYDGPLDGRQDLMYEENKKPFYIVPYIPKDEGERGEVFGMMNGMPMYQPNLAYYRELADGEYIYVRDITVEEYNYLAETGQPPSV